MSRRVFLSTVDDAGDVRASLPEALFRSLAPDGGLYVPERLDPFSANEIDELLQLPFVDGSVRLLARLGVDLLSNDELHELVADAIDFPLPVSPAGQYDGLSELQPGGALHGIDLRCLELFWGPTLAFKDVGARFMARLMQRLRQHPDALAVVPAGGEVTILAATSGDTGSAVAQAFLGVEGFRVVVLYPSGQVSPAQRRLFTTLGQNVRALEIDGTFDDCQKLVKQAFADRALRRDVALASANSISLGRLLPQTLYYYELCRQLRDSDRRLLVCTPSGNFGNLTAGLYGRHLGLPIERFLAATNRNDIVPRFLGGAEYRARPSVQTPSNAMDVGDPSNFRRIQTLYGNEGALRDDLWGAWVDDERTLETMAKVFRETGVVIDPHAAVALAGLLELPERDLSDLEDPSAWHAVFLGTAHPAKFADTVEQATGTAPDLPAALREALERPEQIESMPADYDPLRELLRST